MNYIVGYQERGFSIGGPWFVQAPDGNVVGRFATCRQACDHAHRMETFAKTFGQAEAVKYGSVWKAAAAMTPKAAEPVESRPDRPTYRQMLDAIGDVTVALHKTMVHREAHGPILKLRKLYSIARLYHPKGAPAPVMYTRADGSSYYDERRALGQAFGGRRVPTT